MTDSSDADDADKEKLITVCNACLTAACWWGIFYCDNYKSAGTKELTIAELKKLDREDEFYWSLK